MHQVKISCENIVGVSVATSPLPPQTTDALIRVTPQGGGREDILTSARFECQKPQGGPWIWIIVIPAVETSLQ